MTQDEFAAQLEKLIAEARGKGLPDDFMGEALLTAAEALILSTGEADSSDDQVMAPVPVILPHPVRRI
jgi:hypothetical protein